MKEYKPSFIFRNKHINTCFPSLFRKISVTYTRERINTYDGDFIDIDWKNNNNDKLVILCHGLEGSSKSKYIQGHAKYFSERNYDILAINYRGCTGENRKPTFYHAGLTDDLKLLVEEKGKNYKYICLVGFSLGANLILKYLGTENNLPKNLTCSAVVSPPCDFTSSAEQLKRPQNFIYKTKFLTKLKRKVEKKYNEYPEYRSLFDVKKIRNSKNLEEFDDACTARFFGFKGVKDYYSKVSSKKDIKNIKIPTYILTPKDDPIMGKECYPYEEAKDNKNIFLETPKYGGHVGFSSFKDYPYVLEEKIFEFINNNIIK